MRYVLLPGSNQLGSDDCGHETRRPLPEESQPEQFPRKVHQQEMKKIARAVGRSRSEEVAVYRQRVNRAHFFRQVARRFGRAETDFV